MCYNVITERISESLMKNNFYKKNDMGKWVLDFMDKKTFKKVAKRKVRKDVKKGIDNYDRQGN